MEDQRRENKEESVKESTSNNSEMDKKDEKQGVGYYFDLKEVATYFFRKKDPNRKSNFNLRAMHTINKISMLMFLVCIIILIVRWVSRM